ncbi:MAG: ATP-binding protein [Candidatus Nitrosopolaris sp.]
MSGSSQSSNFFSSFFSKNETLIKYTLVPSIPLSIIAILSINGNTWVLSEIHHFYIEMFAVILATILSFYYISRYRTLNDKFSLFLGIGFLANASIDLLHVVVSYNSINEPLFLKYFIPQTWFAGRLFLSAMFAMAIAGYPILSRKEAPDTGVLSISSSFRSRKKRQVQHLSPSMSEQDRKEEEEQERIKRESRHNRLQQKILLVSLAILAGIAATSAVSSLFLVFPGLVLDNYPLHRPYEIPPLILFLVALFYFYKNRLDKKNDVFYKGIVASILIDAFAELIMSYSSASFDTAHNVAHILKDAAYFVNIIGLALSSINYNLRLKESNDSLGEINARLREREELIRSQYERLKESDKMKNEFINVASHELRTPIQPILSLSALLRPKIRDVQQQELLDVIIRNAKRLLRLTEAILDVTKIESQSLTLKKERFDLNDVIINVMDDISLSTGFLNNENITLSYEPQHITLEADKGRIIQVISNLLGNGIKFTKEGTITVTSEIKDGEVFVSISDTGQGLDPEVLPQLFTKFSTKSPLHGVQMGTGLGLFISKSIIEAHGGKIWAENNNGSDGTEGATFCFTLPIVNKEQQQKRQQLPSR